MNRFLFAVILCGASCLAANASSTKIAGYISDSKCAAKHSTASPDDACVKGCIKGGASPVLVDDAKGDVWTIDNPDAVKNDYGRRVNVVAKVNEANKSVHISKASLVK